MLFCSVAGNVFALELADVSAQFAKDSSASELVSISDGGETISWRIDFSSLSASKQTSTFEQPATVSTS